MMIFYGSTKLRSEINVGILAANVVKCLKLIGEQISVKLLLK